MCRQCCTSHLGLILEGVPDNLFERIRKSDGIKLQREEMKRLHDDAQSTKDWIKSLGLDTWEGQRRFFNEAHTKVNPRKAVGFCVEVTGEAISDASEATNIKNYADDPYATI